MLISWLVFAGRADAFCGFYVAKADTKLFNKASKVVLARDGERTVLTMANDFKGDIKEFALVIPVPTVLEKGQINVGDSTLIDRIDAFTAPRLVEYFDEDPCQPFKRIPMMAASNEGATSSSSGGDPKNYGIKIEASYTVGEYDILILSAKESSGLQSWLDSSGYRVPAEAKGVLESYIKQGLKFFVAKVNIAEQTKTGFTYLRPIQIAYESPRFMLPLRLGTINADGEQELFIFGLSRGGRIEATNYRMSKVPTDSEIPVYIKTKDKFTEFYRAMFTEHLGKENNRVVMLEYAWNVSSCDPCAAEPLTNDELRKLGAFWLHSSQGDSSGMGVRPIFQFSDDTYVTRMHVRYTSTTFPDDLMLQTTGNQELFQGRYIIRHPWTGSVACAAGENYSKELVTRQEQEAQTLARLTGWQIADIRQKIGIPEREDKVKTKWWENIW